jgi:anti-sigma regulatory factor (Ser/Thr protein kinase)/PAS domain-containing protein
MASAPSERGPIRGRLDGSDRLVSADPDLVSLQREAGSELGAELALPQIAAIARMARKLGVPVSRPALAAGAEQDVELWVRATPEGEEVTLSLERWTARAPASPRLAALVAHEQEVESGGAADDWAADENFAIVSISPGLAEKLGVSPEEAVSQPLTRLFKLEENEDGELPLLAAATSRSDFLGQRARPRRGSDELLILRGNPVTGPDGRFAGFKGEAVGEGAPSKAGGSRPGASPLDQVIDEALRSPLDRIIDSADSIVQQSEGPLRSDYADYASDIAAAARHLLSVIRSMNGEARQDQDRGDLIALANEAAGMLEAAAEPRGIAIAVQPNPPLIARGDPRGVIQILVNLVGNAVRHSPDGATVAISFESSDSFASVHVVDHGPGIDPADQQRIFERFERASGSEGGTGLGLAIARRLARSMGGDILLESTPGEGACFTLALPVA